MRTALHPTTKSSEKPSLRPDWDDLPKVKKATIDNDMVVVTLKDGRVVQFPVAWSKTLSAATAQQKSDIRVTPLFLFWDEVDEVIGIENILYGEKLYLK